MSNHIPGQWREANGLGSCGCRGQTRPEVLTSGLRLFPWKEGMDEHGNLPGEKKFCHSVKDTKTQNPNCAYCNCCGPNCKPPCIVHSREGDYQQRGAGPELPYWLVGGEWYSPDDFPRGFYDEYKELMNRARRRYGH